MTVLAVLQARMSSRRLPGKVLSPIEGRPMLMRQIDRIRRASRIDALTVATSKDPSDDPIAKACAEDGVDVFRGSLDDVLDRFYRAASERKPDHVVRLTGDCPLTDPRVVDRVVDEHVAGNFDYTSNAVPPTFPDGLDCEAMTLASLETAWREARLPSEREHVTPFLYHHPERFRLGHVAHATDLSSLRWTVDEPEDLAVVSAIYAALLPRKPDFGMDDILGLAGDHPEIFRANGRFRRNEGYEKSLEKDAAQGKPGEPR